MPSSFRSIASLLLVPLLLATDSVAATFLADGYAVRIWQTEDGLPQNLVTSVLQTRDGYLWFGTHNGLARFDGERFETFDPSNTAAFKTGLINSLFEDAEGTLWIGDDTGEITRYREGRFEPYKVTSPAGTESVVGIGTDENGHLWAMRADGTIDSLDQGVSLPSLLKDEHAHGTAWSRSNNGAIWLAVDGQPARLVNGQLVPQALPPTPTGNYVTGLGASADGGAWVLCNGRIRKWDGVQWTEDRGEQVWGSTLVSCCLELRDGTLAVATFSGLYLIFKDGRKPFHLDDRMGLPQKWIRQIYEDREGNLWAGLGRSGLMSIHPTAFSSLNAREQWNGSTVLSVAAGRNGTLWVGTDGDSLHRYTAGEWTRYGPNEGLRNWWIPAVTETTRGAVWTSDSWWGGPYRLQGGQFVRPPSVDPGASAARALLEVPGTDDLLVGNLEGLRRLHGDTSTWLIKNADKSKGGVCAIALDQQGAIWCGFTQGGVASLLNGEIKYFRQEDGLSSNVVEALSVEKDGTVWVGTADGGLNRIKNGRVTRLGLAHGLIDRHIAYILDDGLGYLWLSTHHGLQRVAKTELNRCADGSTATFASQVYDQHDGLPIIEFTGGVQAAGCKTADGRLWFATSKGLIGVDPAHIVPNPLAPPVVIGAPQVDGKTMATRRGAIVGALAPDHQRLEFPYSGLSFAAPNKVLFKYRLDGFDRDWVDAGAKRTAFYTRLPAGSYRFHVIACNNDGVWNNTGAVLAFTVAPFFWQTWWFVGLSLVAAAAVIAWIARYFTRRRMQRKMELMQRQHEIERERARIAQDIHDDVGASLSRIAMLSQPVRSDLTEPEVTAAMLSRIYATAREVTRSLDEIVWAIDPRHDTLDSLVDYMGKFAQHFLAATNVRCRLDLPVEVPAWPLTAETRHNLFLAFKEALNNVAKHASADEVRISFRLEPDSFLLVVKDNGCGIGPTRPRSTETDRVMSGNGLANMQARLARIGGRCEIASALGEGTTVSFIISVTRPSARVALSSHSVV